MQTSLFQDEKPLISPSIDGLTHIANYISKAEEVDLVETINWQPWLHDLKRRVQHYGYRYDYKARNITLEHSIGELPDWIAETGIRLFKDGLVSTQPDQVIVNEYLPGQGIASHTDCATCFGGEIVSLSLGSACVMDFSHSASGQKSPVLLQPRDLVVMSGAARYEWQHGIAGRKTDRYHGTIIHRQRRLSLTFRKVILNNASSDL